MTETTKLAQVPPIDAQRPQLILVVGRKGSGKSVVARQLFTDWPHDKVAVDVNGDADPGEGAKKITVPLPTRMPPPRDDGRPNVLHFRADPGDPSYREHLDQAAGLALNPSTRPGLVWFDEWAEVGRPGQIGPHVHRLLMQSRHHLASALMCCPRPMNIDPLSVSQADYVYIFDIPNPRDRERLADNIGVAPKALMQELDITGRRGKHWHMRWDAREHELIRCPPLPYVPTENAKPS